MHADDENKVFHYITKDQIYVEKITNNFDDFSQQTIFR